jgi:hypothetical protein
MDKVLVTNNYGGYKIHRTNKCNTLSFIKLQYASRAFEWLNILKLFQEFFIFFQFFHLYSFVDDNTFAWSYTNDLSMVFYKLSAVFKNFLS